MMDISSNSSEPTQDARVSKAYTPEIRRNQAMLYQRLMEKTLTFEDLEQQKEVLDKEIYIHSYSQCNCGINILSLSINYVTGNETTVVSSDKIQKLAQCIERGYCDCVELPVDDFSERRIKACSLVHLAATSDDFLPVLKHLHTLGCDFEAVVPERGSTPIHIAVERNQLQNVKYLVSIDVDVNVANVSDEVPLYVSVHFEHEEVFKELLKAPKINVNCKDTRRQPLLINCVRFHPEFVHSLLKEGADANQKGAHGHTALMYAVTSRDVELVRLLISYGADVNMANDRKEIALLIVVYRDDVQMVQILLEAGADPNYCTPDEQNSLLLLASYDGCVAVISQLIKFGADVRVCNNLKYSPLHIAAWNGHLACVKALIAAGAPYDTKTSDLNTPLALATHGGHLSVIEEFLPLGCDVNNRDKDMDTPLLYAAFNGMTKGVELLMSYGADPNMRNSKDTSVLWNAVHQRKKELVKLLIVANVELECTSVGIEQHSQVDQVVHLYATPRSTLWVAVDRGASEIALLLISAGYNIYQEEWLVNGDFPEKSNDTRLHEMLMRYVHNPPRLLTQCRTFFRRYFGKDVKEKVSQMYIPNSLKDYLTFADLKYSVESDSEPVLMEDSD